MEFTDTLKSQHKDSEDLQLGIRTMNFMKHKFSRPFG